VPFFSIKTEPLFLLKNRHSWEKCVGEFFPQRQVSIHEAGFFDGIFSKALYLSMLHIPEGGDCCLAGQNILPDCRKMEQKHKKIGPL